MADIIRSFYNIEEHGAVEATLINTILQNAFNMHMHKTTVYIPGKRYFIDETITTPTTEGGTIYGAGFGYDSNVAGSANRCVARLIWKGAKNKPMIKIQNTNINFCGGLTLIGKNNGVDNTLRASIGILVSKPANSTAGQISFNSLTLADCDTLFQCGASYDEINNDQIIINYFNTSGSSETVYKLISNGATKHHIPFLHNRSITERVFQVYGGGLIYVMGGLSFGSVMLEIPTAAYGVSQYTGMFRFDNIKVDDQSGSAFKGVRCLKPSSNVKVVFNNLFIAYDHYYTDNAFCFEAYGKMDLTLRNMRSLQYGMFRMMNHTDGKPNVYVNRGRLYTHTSPAQFMYPDSTGCYLTLQDGSNYPTTPIVDTINYNFVG